MITVITLGAFGVYTFLTAFDRGFGESGPYVSPMFSVPWPGLTEKEISLPFPPAFLWLWIPLGFRATCYYYRKSYYRAFFWDPPACAVPELRKSYTGERQFPFVLNNLHRYFWYLGLPVVLFLWIDALKSLWFEGHFHLGLGSIIMLVNVVLISYYTFSCHAWRHIAGGCVNCFSKNKTRYTLWQRITHINEQHGFWAWVSMMAVWFTDIYIRLCAHGTITDLKIFG